VYTTICGAKPLGSSRLAARTKKKPGMPELVQYIGQPHVGQKALVTTLPLSAAGALPSSFTPFITSGQELTGANKLVSWMVRQLRKYSKFIYRPENQAQYKL
jgi:hypothetical protein